MKNLLYLCWLVSGFALAVQVEDLYESDVPVDNRSDRVRLEAMQQGFADVLVRASGRASVLNDDVVEQAIQRADSWVAQFGYRTEQIVEPASEQKSLAEGVPVGLAGDGSQLPPPEPIIAEQLYLSIRFDPAAVDDIMHSAQIPVWGSLRPYLSVSAGVDAQGRVSGLNEQQQAWLLAAMARRGLPLKLVGLNSNTLSSLKWHSQEPAAPPEQDVAVVLWLEHDGLGWSASYSVGLGASTWQAQQHNESLFMLINQVVDQWAESLVQRLAPQVDVSQGVVLQVENIQSVSDLAQMERYLRGLSAVDSLRLARVGAEFVWMIVELTGSQSQLQQVLALGENMHEVPQYESAAQVAVLNYQWHR